MRLILMLLLLSACQPSLERQPRIKPYSEGAVRIAPEDTHAREDSPHAPLALSAENLRAGQDLYRVHCAVCHGFSGKGDGMAVQRGFPKPDVIVEKITPVNETIAAIANGKGKMFGLGERLSQNEQRQIAFYVRALQWHAHPPKELAK